jgi:hypothetical protein
MSEVVERVARAMWESEPIIYGWSHSERKKHGTWDAAVKNDCYGVGIYRGFARAAIEAMGEPTEAMCRAGRQAQPTVTYIYEAMIDEALK